MWIFFFIFPVKNSDYSDDERDDDDNNSVPTTVMTTPLKLGGSTTVTAVRVTATPNSKGVTTPAMKTTTGKRF